MKPIWYFAYGSNMNPQRVRDRGIVTVGDCVEATLSNYQLRFNKISRKAPHTGHANIVAKTGQQVEGVLYQLAKSSEIQKMDPYEYAPIDYSRVVVFVQHKHRMRLAWTYIANAVAIDDNLQPPRWYLEHLLLGSKYLSAEYLAMLRNIECLPETHSAINSTN